jgi:hypothetical protein
VRPVGLDAVGRIPVDAFAAALASDGVALATALIANNEVGTVNDAARSPLRRVGRGSLHLDAVAAFGHLPLSFAKLRGDAPAGAGLVALSVAGHKIGAPTGTGALVVARTARLAPLQHGGGQQRGLRSGTQDVAGAAAFALAAELAVAERAAESVRLGALRDRLVAGIRERVPASEVLGDPDPAGRLPGNAHLLFPGAPSESLLFLLDVAGSRLGRIRLPGRDRGALARRPGSRTQRGRGAQRDPVHAGADLVRPTSTRCSPIGGAYERASARRPSSSEHPGARGADPDSPRSRSCGARRLLSALVDWTMRVLAAMSGAWTPRSRRRAPSTRVTTSSACTSRSRARAEPCAPAAAAAARSRTRWMRAARPTSSASRSTSGTSPSGSART